MRIGINILLILIILGLSYVLVDSIREPIEFESQRTLREGAVTDRLDQIRIAQESFREITGKFAHNFDTLQQVLSTEDFRIISILGDADAKDAANEIVYDTTFVSAKDSIMNLGINIDSLPFIPWTNNERFEIKADTMTYQATLVYVTEVGTNRNKYMGKYSDPKYKRYDDTYEPDKFIKFGDMTKPSLAGNW